MDPKEIAEEAGKLWDNTGPITLRKYPTPESVASWAQSLITRALSEQEQTIAGLKAKLAAKKVSRRYWRQKWSCAHGAMLAQLIARDAEKSRADALAEQYEALEGVLRGDDCEADGDGPCGVCRKCRKRDRAELADLRAQNDRVAGEFEQAKSWGRIQEHANKELAKQLAAAGERGRELHEALTQAMHAIRHVTCVAGAPYAGGPKLREALGGQIWALLVACEEPGHKALTPPAPCQRCLGSGFVGATAGIRGDGMVYKTPCPECSTPPDSEKKI